eukprot:CAMPEP_0174268318 /NCGR_PEP_ID=MMETSP0439-20130205/37002_1 /TAXON_ID=0 /ORGANISM="Stereomyxa ramosa, Strain Chinc5" /LENGTH=71 /DNA_ID=CAMNT_0015356413 /DNA_START=54 /DNA_END=266 /DNA_ORIENTATION=+
MLQSIVKDEKKKKRGTAALFQYMELGAKLLSEQDSPQEQIEVQEKNEQREKKEKCNTISAGEFKKYRREEK